MSKKEKKQKSQDVTFGEMLRAEEELVKTKREYGILEEERKHNIIARFFDRQEGRIKVSLSKKKYIILLILTGWFGGHRFYAHMWFTAVLYLALCWTGLPLAMCLVDLLVIIPMKPDEDGRVFM